MADERRIPASSALVQFRFRRVDDHWRLDPAVVSTSFERTEDRRTLLDRIRRYEPFHLPAAPGG